MVTANSGVQFNDHWCNLQMCASCPSGKTPFPSEEETCTLPNAETDTEHEPRGKEVELTYINTNCKYITHHLQSN